MSEKRKGFQQFRLKNLRGLLARVTGFEPATNWVEARHSTKLSYTRAD